MSGPCHIAAAAPTTTTSSVGRAEHPALRMPAAVGWTATLRAVVDRFCPSAAPADRIPTEAAIIASAMTRMDRPAYAAPLPGDLPEPKPAVPPALPAVVVPNFPVVTNLGTLLDVLA